MALLIFLLDSVSFLNFVACNLYNDLFSCYFMQSVCGLLHCPVVETLLISRDATSVGKDLDKTKIL